jgi:hypothetical protein
MALYAIGGGRLNILVGQTNSGRRTKAGVARGTRSCCLVRDVICGRNTAVKTGRAVAQRTVTRAWMQVIPHKELGGTGRNPHARPGLKTEIRRSGRYGVFVHANPNATSIVATVATGGHACMNQLRLQPPDQKARCPCGSFHTSYLWVCAKKHQQVKLEASR